MDAIAEQGPRLQRTADRPFARLGVDLCIALALLVSAGVATWLANRQVHPAIYEFDLTDVWFDGDTARLFANETDAGSNHYRTKVHPLFSLLTYPVVHALSYVTSPLTAVKLFHAGIAAVWAALFYALLRLMRCRPAEALLFTLVAATSAAAIFWFPIPDTYPLGSLSIVLGLGFAALAEYRKPGGLLGIACSAATLSITLTNWMVGLLATVLVYRWRRFLLVTGAALALVAAAALVQRAIFPTAGLFFMGSGEEATYLLGNGGPAAVMRSFFVHTMVMPAMSHRSGNTPYWPLLSTQASALGSGSLWGTASAVLWLALLALGLAGLVTTRRLRALRLTLAGAVLGQLALHAVYGRETFLYSLHFLPLLGVLAAFAVHSRWRRLAVGLACAVIALNIVNNSREFSRATSYLASHVTPRDQVLVQMRARPADPWPRDAGHVVLAPAGSSEEQKAYLEPGGSFSPAVNTFGVSVWMVDRRGARMVSSDTIPLSAVSQRFVFQPAGGPVPAVQTSTDRYAATWERAAGDVWKLALSWPRDRDEQPRIVVRSPGPAGGPVRQLDWDGQRVLINGEWAVQGEPAIRQVHFDDERDGLAAAAAEGKGGSQSWQGDAGWGVAVLTPPAAAVQAGAWTLTLAKGGVAQAVAGGPGAATGFAISTRLPDDRFQASIEAQMAHLRMGLVGDQTRPGDPMQYPLQWLRDGAFVVAAIAEAGDVELAQRLSIPFAEHDFFGGFGSEIDAPGLALWVLREVSDRAGARAYDEWLWPHVRRKAELIMECMQTRGPVEHPYTGPIVPVYAERPDLRLVCEAPENGLINGRMDWRRPDSYATAVSYGGLRDAAHLARRLGAAADAMRWEQAAQSLQAAWRREMKSFGAKPAAADLAALPAKVAAAWRSKGLAAAKEAARSVVKGPRDATDPRTYIAGLWPTAIASPDRDLYEHWLEAKWNRERDPRDGAFLVRPEWTYFDVSEAHQWLALGRPDKVWPTLEWFWTHQTSPGLYTWWEAMPEVDYLIPEINSFHHWDAVRGWVHPREVTPHYFTAAEMLLLQLDMLAHVDDSGAKPVLVVGGGVPRAWIGHPLAASGVWTRAGRVDWTWQAGELKVKVAGPPVEVRPGPSFPADTRLDVQFAH